MNQEPRNENQNDELYNRAFDGQTQNNNYYTAPGYTGGPLRLDDERAPIGQGAGIAALVLGIFSLVCCCTGPLALIVSILGIVFAVIDRKKAGIFRGMALTGLILSIIGLLLSAYMTLDLVVSMNLMMNDPAFWEAWQDAMNGDMTKWNEYMENGVTFE